MRQQEVAIETIRPIQRMVKDDPVLHYMRKFLRMRRGEHIEVPGVLLMPLGQSDGPEQFIALDGHHRTRAADELGRLTVPGMIFDTDEDLQSDVRTRVIMRSWKRGTAAEILNMYHNTWEPLLEGSAMHRVGDLWMFSDNDDFDQRAEQLRAEMAAPLGAE
jgi:hypothetical protein